MALQIVIYWQLQRYTTSLCFLELTGSSKDANIKQVYTPKGAKVVPKHMEHTRSVKPKVKDFKMH